MKAVLKKELRIGFARPEVYAFFGVTLLSVGIAAAIQHALIGHPDFQLSLPYGLWALILAVPLLTMGAWRDERRQNTDRLLGALPLRPGGIVLGKYVALLVPLGIVTLILLLYALIPLALGAPSLRGAWGMTAYFFAFGAAALGAGLFQSLLAVNRWDALVSTAALLALACFAPQLSAFLLAMAAVPLYVALLCVLGFILAWIFSHRLRIAVYGLVVGLAVPLALLFTRQVSLLNDLVSGLLNLFARIGDLDSAQTGLLYPSTLLVNLGIAALFVVWTALLSQKSGKTEVKRHDA
ncbi:MAG TPA: ABC-2 transporter permease [Clostridia bacterium]|nr:ABC-2 transporter permease [Clostridia bacterium]